MAYYTGEEIDIDDTDYANQSTDPFVSITLQQKLLKTYGTSEDQDEYMKLLSSGFDYDATTSILKSRPKSITKSRTKRKSKTKSKSKSKSKTKTKSHTKSKTRKQYRRSKN